MLETAGKDLGLDGGAQRDRFVGVLRRVKLRSCRAMVIRAQAQAAARFFEFRAAKKFRHELADQRHAGLAADENDLVEVLCFQLRVGERAQAMWTRSGDNIASETLEFRAREFMGEAELGS